MREHFEKIRYLYGDDCMIRLPNSVFRTLSSSIKNKNGSSNSQQIAFSYVYLIVTGFLYKYAHFVDIDTGTYIQNSDIKQLLGYSKTTKSIDHVIKKDGILDFLSLTATIKDYPIRFDFDKAELINNIPIREFTMVSELVEDDPMKPLIKKTVKNRNYEVKEPLYMTTATADTEYGTLYSVERTHAITISELIRFLFDEDMDNTHFLLYGYLKSRCKGYQQNMKSMAVYKMTLEMGIDRSTFYNRLEFLKNQEYIAVNHKRWKNKQEYHVNMEANDYYWLGL